MAQLEPGDQSWLMIASIVGCIVSIAYLVATTELGLDTSPHFQINYSVTRFFGYMGKGLVQEGSVVLALHRAMSGDEGALRAWHQAGR